MVKPTKNEREKEGVKPGPPTQWAAASGQMLPISMLSSLFDLVGRVDVDRMGKVFQMSRSQLAETAGLPTATLSKAERRSSRKAQRRMTEMVEILSRIREWAGGEMQAMTWYRSQPIPALDGRTPEALVKSGRAGAVREYLDHLALGGFA